MRRLLGCVVLAVLMGACAADVDDTAPPFDDELRYGHAGGIAGRIEELPIRPDGSAELTSRGREPVTFTLDDDELGELAAALEAADLAQQPAEQMSDPAIPDAFTFELAYDGARVLGDEFAAADDLRPALEQLRALVEEHRPAS